MTVTNDLLDGINADAKAYQQAKALYEKAFRAFHARVKALPPEDFWPMVDVFRKVVLKTMLYGRERIGEAAADEFMRLAAIGESPWSVSEAVHFCLSYRHYEDLAHAGGDECRFGFDRGDDGYGDLMDAVVLLGREFNERLHAGRFYDLADFNQAVGERCHNSVTAGEFPFTYSADPAGNRKALESRFKKMVLSGESYYAMSLEEAAAKWVAYESVKQKGEGDE